MSTAPALNAAIASKWTILNGSMAGSVRVLTAGTFNIGRSAENEIVLVNDPKCSRKHASAQSTADGYVLTAMSEANPVYVNGEEKTVAVLQDGDVITFGDTKVQFNLTNGLERGSQTVEPAHFEGSRTAIALVEPTPPPPMSPSAAPVRSYSRPQSPSRARPSSPRRSSKPKQSNTGRYVIFGVIALIVGFLMLPSGKKADKIALRTEQQIEADIAEANKLAEKAQALPIKKIDESLTARQAQENYVRGFRDFRKGQYERSLDSFQACLALDPNHNLCTRYLRLAQRKFNELVQYNIILGRKYRDQNQFKNCRAAFRNVMIMVKDANSAAYKEAKANFDACNAMVEGRY